MQANDFGKFVADQQGSESDPQVDWAEMRREFLQSLDSLYQQIIGFLQDYVTSGSIRYSFTEITLNEENIGIYRAKRMDIRIGKQYVYLEPIGTLLIATKGRVDVVGSAGTAKMMLVDKHVKHASDLIHVTVSTSGNMPPLPIPRTEPVRGSGRSLSVGRP